jgi:hypothetical protein
MPDWGAAFLAVLTVVLMTCWVGPAFADPYPPSWNSGTGAAIHFSPAPWPNEPANPADCGSGSTCGDWKPYSRFQNNITDPRINDPSNGGTSPQNYVNISFSCTDKTLPSIYYNLHQDADPTKDVIFFRWRVEQIVNNYATGPSAGSYGASDPWSSALWTVLFDVNGDGYVDLAAHLDGSSGAPATPIDRIAGIWSKLPTQSLDYVGDPTNVKLLAHNPTAFVDQATNKILNFQSSLGNTLSTHKELAAELEAKERPIGFTVDSGAGKETA